MAYEQLNLIGVKGFVKKNQYNDMVYTLKLSERILLSRLNIRPE